MTPAIDIAAIRRRYFGPAHCIIGQLIDHIESLDSALAASGAEVERLRAVVEAADRRRAKGAPDHAIWREYDAARSALTPTEAPDA